MKFHINIPVDTDNYTIQATQLLCEKALAAAGYQMQSVTLWRATLGMSGWRVSVVFNLPPTPTQAGIVEAVTAQTSLEKWGLEGTVTAWLHP